MSLAVSLTLAAVGILLTIILVQATHFTLAHGVQHAMGNRADAKASDGFEGRVDRARANTIENLALFLPLMLLAIATQRVGGLVTTGATVFVIARVVYTGAYFGGIAGLRTVSWFAGIVGTVVVALGILS